MYIHKFVTRTVSVSWRNRMHEQTLVACGNNKRHQQNMMLNCIELAFNRCLYC